MILRPTARLSDSARCCTTDESVVNFLSELQRHADGRWLQPTALHTRCVPHVNYTIHGHILVIHRAQRFQERSLLSVEGMFLSFATRQRLYTFATYVCVLFAFLILLILYKCTKNPILYKIHKIQSSIYTYSRIQTRNEILFVI